MVTTDTLRVPGPPRCTALAISVGVPLMIYALYFGCTESTGGCPPPWQNLPENILMASISNPLWWASLWDTQASLIYLAWYTFCVVAWAVLPGDQVEGLELRSGRKKKYKINAFSTLLLALGATSGHILRFGPESFTFIYEKWTGFVTASLLMSIAQAVFVYAMSFQEGKLLALGGNSGSFDIKSFNELRPGLILWALIDISMGCEQAVRRGGLSKVTDSMWLVLAFQIWYIGDALYNEPAILTTMDITTDGFGFMLAVAVTWVPFVYSLQARYLAFDQIELGPVNTLAIIAVNMLGYCIFRAANGEKNDFRNGKNPKDLKLFTTQSGRKLLTSGWWGASRHPNYLGDMIMALAWLLLAGFNTPITYFYVTYFAVVLIHRQLRDDDNCEKKYGKDWDHFLDGLKHHISSPA